MTLLELLELLKKHLKLMVVVTVLSTLGAAAFAFTRPDQFTASTDLYVLARQDAEAGGALNSDLSASQMLTNDVSSLIQSSRIADDVARDLGIRSLKGYSVSVTSTTNTRVITVSVSGADADHVAQVANSIGAATDSVAQEVMGIESVNVINEAERPTQPSGPNRKLFVAVGLMAGIFVAVAIIVLLDMLNQNIRGVKDVEETLGVTVIGRIPHVEGGVN